jgi:hypothetical protein
MLEYFAQNAENIKVSKDITVFLGTDAFVQGVYDVTAPTPSTAAGLSHRRRGNTIGCVCTSDVL